MAVTCRTIIQRALSKLGVLRVGGEPSAAEAAEGLSVLESMFQEWVNAGTFGRIWPVNVGSAATFDAGGNVHYSVTTPEAVMIELPATMPWNGCWFWRPERDYGWGLPAWEGWGVNVPQDLTVVSITDQYGFGRATYIYDGPVQRWVKLEGLTLDDEAPLSARNSDGLASVLAIRLSDVYGESPQPATIGAASRFRIALVTNHGKPDTYCAEIY